MFAACVALFSEMLYAFLATSFWPAQGQNEQLQITSDHCNTHCTLEHVQRASAMFRQFCQAKQTIATVSGARHSLKGLAEGFAREGLPLRDMAPVGRC